MSGTETDGSGIVGQQGLNSATSQFNMHDFQIDQAFGKNATVKIVKVMGVQNTGALSPVGFVDVKAMVNLVDGLLGTPMQHETVFGLPYFRLQGGKNAIVIDPVVGDIGFAVICDRDISTVKANKDFANPGSYRRFSLSDGIYVGGILNDTPEQAIQFNNDGITLTDKNGGILQMKSDGLHYNKPFFLDGGLNISGSIKALDGSSTYANAILTTGTVEAGVGGADHVTLQQHIHPSNGAPPTPGH